MTIGYSIDHTEDVKGQASNLHATRDVRAANGQSSSSYCSDLSLVDFQWGRLTTRRFTQSWRSRALNRLYGRKLYWRQLHVRARVRCGLAPQERRIEKTWVTVYSIFIRGVACF